MNTKRITFNPDGSQNEPDWDRIDPAVDEETDKEALQELNEK